MFIAQNTPIEQIDTPLEYYFGLLAGIALVVTWLWLWLKIRGRVRQAETELQAPEPK